MNPLSEYALKNVEINKYDKENYCLEKSKDGRYIIKIKKDEKEIYIGSKYSVSRDIQYFISQIGEFNVNTIFVVFGLGSGEQILELLNHTSNTNKLLIVESDINIIAIFNSLEYSKKILDDERVTLMPMDVDKLNNILALTIEEFNSNNVKVLTYVNYDKIYVDEYIQFYKSLKNFLESNVINIGTNYVFSQQFFKCFVKNLKHIVKSRIINEFKNTFERVPAIVVSAGPSLEKNINLLKEVKDKFIIISGGRTVKPLEKAGVIPDFVAVIDAGEASYKVIENSLECMAPLVFCEVTNHDVVDQYKGKKIFFQEGYHLANVTPELLGKKVDAIFQGGSVAHTCTSFAQYIGCNPIIFIGQDFAYTNNKKHADIASIIPNNEHSEDGILVKDIFGELIPTSRIFNNYRRYMERFIKKASENTFINSTEGGANIEGTIVMDLKEVIQKYEPSEKFDKKAFEILDSYGTIDASFVKTKIEKLMVDMKSIKKDCKKAVKDSNEVLQYYSIGKSNDIAKLLNNMNKINGRIQKISFLECLLKPTIFRFLMNPDYMEKMNESQKEKGIRLANQSKRLYEEIIIAIDEAMPLIKECI
jgi:hypothetical protein